MPAPARRAALKALRVINEGRADLPTALMRVRASLADARDRALTTDIVTGTLRWRAALDHVVAHHAQRSISTLDADVCDLLRLSAYQLTHLERVPPSAVVNDAVDIARAIGRPRAAGLVNAVLRAIVRDLPTLPLPPRPAAADRPAQAALDYLSITLSHPRWLVARWLDHFGFEATEQWARFNNIPAPPVLRVNTLRTSTSDLIARLAALGVEVESATFAPDALVVRRGNPLTTKLAGRGLFVAQDESSQLVGAFAGARPGDRTLDLCAAPGNKTLALAADMADRGVLVACDLRPRRVDLLRRTIATLQLHVPRIVRADALSPLPFRGGFDLVVIDAPCSGLGTIRRDPEIRWRRTADDLAKFAEIQIRMMENAAPVVRPGGRLVYATCSSEPEENEQVVERFLNQCPEFQRADLETRGRSHHAGLDAVTDAVGDLRPLPWVHGLEAFFAAMLVKVRRL